METPNTEAGRATERVMAVILFHVPNLPPSKFNPIYKKVLDELEKIEFVTEELGRDAAGVIEVARASLGRRIRSDNDAQAKEDRDAYESERMASVQPLAKS